MTMAFLYRGMREKRWADMALRFSLPETGVCRVHPAEVMRSEPNYRVNLHLSVGRATMRKPYM